VAVAWQYKVAPTSQSFLGAEAVAWLLWGDGRLSSVGEATRVLDDMIDHGFLARATQGPSAFDPYVPYVFNPSALHATASEETFRHFLSQLLPADLPIVRLATPTVTFQLLGRRDPTPAQQGRAPGRAPSRPVLLGVSFAYSVVRVCFSAEQALASSLIRADVNPLEKPGHIGLFLGPLRMVASAPGQSSDGAWPLYTGSAGPASSSPFLSLTLMPSPPTHRGPQEVPGRLDLEVKLDLGNVTLLDGRLGALAEVVKEQAAGLFFDPAPELWSRFYVAGDSKVGDEVHGGMGSYEKLIEALFMSA
jgi:hypothetical protein